MQGKREGKSWGGVGGHAKVTSWVIGEELYIGIA